MERQRWSNVVHWHPNSKKKRKKIAVNKTTHTHTQTIKTWRNRVHIHTGKEEEIKKKKKTQSTAAHVSCFVSSFSELHFLLNRHHAEREFSDTWVNTDNALSSWCSFFFCVCMCVHSTYKEENASFFCLLTFFSLFLHVSVDAVWENYDTFGRNSANVITRKTTYENKKKTKQLRDNGIMRTLHR